MTPEEFKEFMSSWGWLSGPVLALGWCMWHVIRCLVIASWPKPKTAEDMSPLGRAVLQLMSSWGGWAILGNSRIVNGRISVRECGWVDWMRNDKEWDVLSLETWEYRLIARQYSFLRKQLDDVAQKHLVSAAIDYMEHRKS